jgi:outer membrane receptor protein involved in Fe transport
LAIIGILGGLLLVAPRARAQSDSTDSAPGDLEEITVSARRTSESVLKVPESITFFDSGAIEKLGITDFEDYATKIPNLNFTYGVSTLGYAGSQSIAIRGISGGNTTGMYIDDTPIPDSIDPQVVDVKRIEVLKGPQGTLYGAGSMGGNVRIVTQTPEFKDSGSYTMSAGYTDHGSTPDGRLSGVFNWDVIDQVLAVRTNVFTDHEAGFITREFPSRPGSAQLTGEPGQGATTSYGGSVSALIKFSERLSATLRLMGQGIEGHGAPQMFAPLPAFDPEGYTMVRTNDIQELWSDNWYLPSLELHFDAGDWKLVSSSSYFSRKLHDFEDSTEGSRQALSLYYGLGAAQAAAIGQNGIPWTINAQNERFNQEIRASWAGTGPLRANFGARYAHESSDTQFPPLTSAGLVTYGLYPTDLLFDAHTETVYRDSSIFGELYYTWNRFELTLGGRKFWLEQHDSLVQDGFYNGGLAVNPALNSAQSGAVPKVAVSYTLPRGALVYASASKGFRAGGPNQVLPPICDGGIAQLGLTSGEIQQFKSDSLWNYEVGAKDKVGPLTLSAAAFQMDWQGIQQKLVLPVCFLPVTVNAGSARIRGAEFEASGAVANGLEFRVGLGYQDPRILNAGLSGLAPGSRILQVPFFTGTAALSYARPISEGVNGFVSTDYSHIGSSLSGTNSSTYGPYQRAGYGIWNGRIGTEWGANRLELYAKNIANNEANVGDIYPAGYPQIDMNGNPIARVVVLPPLQIGLQFSRKF